jgi:hypothetical protein
MPKYQVIANQRLTQIIEAPDEQTAMEYTFVSGKWESEEIEVLEANPVE